MKKIFIITLSAILCAGVTAQNEKKGYVFTTVDSLGITSVKDQANSGTCWSFSGTAASETAVLSMLKTTFAKAGLDFSEKPGRKFL